MIEIATQISGAVENFVGSEETEPGSGWPYDSFLAAWRAKPRASAREVGSLLVQAYGQRYRSSSDRSTLSAFALGTLNEVLKGIIDLVPELRRTDGAAYAAWASALRFDNDDYVDLEGFLRRARLLSSDLAIPRLRALLNGFVTANFSNCGAGGISIWWPRDRATWDLYQERYSRLNFARRTGWHGFLKDFFCRHRAGIVAADYVLAEPAEFGTPDGKTP